MSFRVDLSARLTGRMGQSFSARGRLRKRCGDWRMPQFRVTQDWSGIRLTKRNTFLVLDEATNAEHMDKTIGSCRTNLVKCSAPAAMLDQSSSFFLASL